MICATCGLSLVSCTCPDIESRLETLRHSPYLSIDVDRILAERLLNPNLKKKIDMKKPILPSDLSPGDEVLLDAFDDSWHVIVREVEWITDDPRYPGGTWGVHSFWYAMCPGEFPYETPFFLDSGLFLDPQNIEYVQH